MKYLIHYDQEEELISVTQNKTLVFARLRADKTHEEANNNIFQFIHNFQL